MTNLPAEQAVMAGGVLTTLVGLGHCGFARLFDWRRDLAKLTLKNRLILNTIHLFLIPCLFLLGYLSLAHTEELAGGSALGRTLSGFCAGLWLTRGIWQVVYFRPSAIRGRDPAAGWLIAIHYGLIAVFFVLTACYTVPVVAWLRS